MSLHSLNRTGRQVVICMATILIYAGALGLLWLLKVGVLAPIAGALNEYGGLTACLLGTAAIIGAATYVGRRWPPPE